MKKKKWLLLFIIALPSLLWIILESSNINSYRLNYFGPKVPGANKDTLFYQVNDNFAVYHEEKDTLSDFKIDQEKYPFFAIMFVKDEYRQDGYRLAGLTEYLLYKTEAVKHIPFFLVSVYEGRKPAVETELKKLSVHPNLKFLSLRKNAFDSLNTVFFKDKPYYIDMSFFVLVDDHRNLRGYYDSRFASEIKRLSDEYKHLRLKNEKEKILQQNEIKKHD